MSEVFGIEPDIDTTQLSSLSPVLVLCTWHCATSWETAPKHFRSRDPCVPALVQFLAFRSNLAALDPIPQNWPVAVLQGCIYRKGPGN